MSSKPFSGIISDISFRISGGALILSNSRTGRENRLAFPGLKVTGYIDAGAHALVFDAMDTLGRNLALKVWVRHADQRYIKRAKSEVQKLVSLGVHRYLVTVHQFGVVDAFPYVVMERIKGVDLKKWLQSKNPHLMQRLLVWGEYSCALHELYEAGVYHGDPHAGNVLVFTNGDGLPKVKLTDFGTSRLWASRGDFVRREGKVVKETADRLFGSNLLSMMDLTGIRSPELILASLDAGVAIFYLLYKLDQEMDERDYDCLRELEDIAELVADVPLFKVDTLTEAVQSRALDPFLHLSPSIIRYFQTNLIAGLQSQHRPKVARTFFFGRLVARGMPKEISKTDQAAIIRKRTEFLRSLCKT